jgi:AraC-like DNA-binding protein
MYTKTSSIQAKPYLDIIHQRSFDETFTISEETVIDKATNFVVQYNKDIYLEMVEGIASIVITNDPLMTPTLFVIHRLVRIKRGMFFSFIANSDQAIIRTYIPKTAYFNVKRLDYPIGINTIKTHFHINEIYAFYYLSKSEDYVFKGEQHPFWELTYVEHGSLIVNVDNQQLTINENEIMFFVPDQFHTMAANNQRVDYITIMFQMDFQQIELLRSNVFGPKAPITENITRFLQSGEQKHILAQEMMLNYLKQIIVLCAYYDNPLPAINFQTEQKFANEIFNEIIHYINSQLNTPIDVPQICKKFGLSRTSLQTLFKNNLQTTPKLYINEQKLQLSQTLLKSKTKTVSETSEALGYTSIHYFSRKFKQRFGINPSDIIQK